MKYEARNTEKTIIAKIEDSGHVVIIEAGHPDFDEARAQAEPYIPPSPEDIAAEQAAGIRAERTKRLAACDWTQLPDAQCDQTAWAAYRQALRDITAQEGFPAEVVWPVAP
jgi:hypothetical protein